MEEYNVIKDLSTLTTIPEDTLRSLVDKLEYCICDNIEETMIKGETQCGLDIGIGILYISFSNGELKYHLKPRAKINDSIVNVLKNKMNVLTNKVESTLIDKVTNTYKDLI